MPTDPVCGMYVEAGPETLQLTTNNRTYYFCCTACRRTFAEPARERTRLERRLAVAWPLAVGVVVCTYAVKASWAVDLAGLLAAVVQFYPGLEFYRGTFDALRQRTANMDLLIAVATSAAFGYSAAVVLHLGSLPPATYFDASSIIIALVLTGNLLEQFTRVRAGSALRHLDEMLPPTAVVLRNGQALSVPSAEVRLGDRCRVLPGGRIPADGVVRAGETTVDESLISGEPALVPKSPGSKVLAGAVNGTGVVELEATAVGTDTFLAEVGRLLADAEMSRVPLQRTADRIAEVFAPLVLALALGASAAWLLIGGASVSVALLVFVAVAITACPCAFGIATPAAIVVGIGRAADRGILFRGEDAIENAARVDTVLLDKTGTLTQGVPELVEVVPAEGVPVGHLLSTAAAVEAGSAHPFARAVIDRARQTGVAVRVAEDVSEAPGRGVTGHVDGVEVDVVRSGVGAADPSLPRELAGPRTRLASLGCSVALVREGGSVTGLLGFRDALAPSAAGGVADLRSDGLAVAMVTGDAEMPARAVAHSVAIERVHSEADPATKLAILRQLQSEGHGVAFVGDGVNDAAVLAAADLGIAIGSGTEVAREAGRVVLVRSDLRDVAVALRLARRTVRKVRGNIEWAVGYNAVLLPVAMGALVPVWGLSVYRLLPIVGAAAMALSSTFVVLNSLSLQWVGLDRSEGPVPRRAKPSHSRV